MVIPCRNGFNDKRACAEIAQTLLFSELERWFCRSVVIVQYFLQFAFRVEDFTADGCEADHVVIPEVLERALRDVQIFHYLFSGQVAFTVQ